MEEQNSLRHGNARKRECRAGNREDTGAVMRGYCNSQEIMRCFLGNATHLNAANYCSCKSRVVLSAKNCRIHQNKPVEKRQHQGHALGITSSHHPGHGRCPCPPGNEVSLKSLPSQSIPAFQDPFPAFLQQYLSHHFFS